MVAVASFDDVVEDSIVFITNRGFLRGVKFHEAMAEVVDGVIINGAEVPWFVLHESGGGRVDGGAICDDFDEGLEAGVGGDFVELFLGEAFESGEEVEEVFLGEFAGVEAEWFEVIGESFGVDGAFMEGPIFGVGFGGALEVVRDHDSF